MPILHRPHCCSKHQEAHFDPIHQLTYGREKWGQGTSPRFRRFQTETEARAFLSALQRRRSKGGRVLAKLEYRDGNGIWHLLPLDGGAK